MKKAMKHSILLFAAMLLLILAAACSSDKNNNKADDTSSNNTASNDNSANNDADKDSGSVISGDLEIQYFVGGYGDTWWKAVIKDFQKKYPDVTVKEQAGPNINDEMRSRWVSGNPPDIVYIDGAGSNETQMVEDGQLMDLTDWVKGVKLPDGSALMDSFIVEPAQYDDGKIYSLPLVFDTWGTWYDKALFKDSGYEVPYDFETFMSTMKKIKADKDIAPFVTTGKYPYYFLRGMLYPAIAAAGGEDLLASVINGDEGAWTNDKVLDVMKKVEKMQKEGFIDPGFGAINHTQSQMNFLLHKNAFIPVGFWLPNEMAEDAPKDFQYGFVPSPMNEKGEPGAIVPDLRPLAIAKEAKNPEAAKAFVEFVFTKKYATLFSEETGAIMNLQGVDLSTSDKVPGYLIDANAMINDPDKVTIYNKPHPMSADLETPIGNSLVSLMLGNISAEKFCQEAEKAAAKYRKGK